MISKLNNNKDELYIKISTLHTTVQLYNALNRYSQYKLKIYLSFNGWVPFRQNWRRWTHRTHPSFNTCISSLLTNIFSLSLRRWISHLLRRAPPPTSDSQIPFSKTTYFDHLSRNKTIFWKKNQDSRTTLYPFSQFVLELIQQSINSCNFKYPFTQKPTIFKKKSRFRKTQNQFHNLCFKRFKKV